MNDLIRFTALCRQCEREVDQGTFVDDALREFLREKTLRFYCPHCDIEWRPSEREYENIARLLRPATVA